MFAMEACARVGIEVSAARATGCALVRDFARGAVRELGFGGLVPLFGEYVGKRGGLAPPFGEHGMDTRPLLCWAASERRAANEEGSPWDRALGWRPMLTNRE